MQIMGLQAFLETEKMSIARIASPIILALTLAVPVVHAEPALPDARQPKPVGTATSQGPKAAVLGLPKQAGTPTANSKPQFPTVTGSEAKVRGVKP
jgi:hypothetical protein